MVLDEIVVVFVDKGNDVCLTMTWVLSFCVEERLLFVESPLVMPLLVFVVIVVAVVVATANRTIFNVVVLMWLLL